MNNVAKNRVEKKKMIALIILVLTLVISTTGATYAYFAIGASVNNVIQGTSATVNQNLVVTKLLPASSKPGTGVMVPQYGANGSGSKKSLQLAVEGGCVDANNNVVCQVYRISYQNGSTGTLRLNSTLQLKGTTVTDNLSITNLKWFPLAELSGQTSAAPAEPTYSYPASNTNFKSSADTALGASATLESTKWRVWYVVIWIQETGNDQYSADGNKSFTGIATVNATDSNGTVIGGITSTFTG